MARPRAGRRVGGLSPERRSPARVAIGLGSNLGDRVAHLRAGISALERLLDDVEVASLYRSPAERPAVDASRRERATLTDDPDYLNTVATGLCHTTPEELLAGLKACELRRGRRSAERFAPRPLDLDLLLWDEMTLDRPELTLPHPRLAERLFVLAPLAELAASWSVPGPCRSGAGQGETVATLLEHCRGAAPIERIDWPDTTPPAAS